MSPHAQFLLADALAMPALAPVCALAWRRRLRHRTPITLLYSVGFGLIALTLLIDTIWNPPLFFHGFVPGIGIGLLLACVGLYLQDARAGRQPLQSARRPGRSSFSST
jgi:hypothetical protein